MTIADTIWANRVAASSELPDRRLHSRLTAILVDVFCWTYSGGIHLGSVKGNSRNTVMPHKICALYTVGTVSSSSGAGRR